MVDKYNIIIGSWWKYMFIAMLNILSHSCFGGLQSRLDKNSFGPKPRGTIKTIEVLDDGEMIDCVLFYKQPAFENPLLNGLKMKASSYPTVLNKTNDTQPKITQSWNKYGECPEGTIPIRRAWNNSDATHPKYSNDAGVYEYATAVHDEKCQGGKARLNVWNPRVLNRKERSLSQIWIVAGSGDELNSIKAGWVVYPGKYGSRKPRFFIYYTSLDRVTVKERTKCNYGDYTVLSFMANRGPDGYRTKCWDLDCRGFVQIDHEFVLGQILEPSVYNGEQMDTLISISRDKDDGHWWLSVDDKVVGFWPHQLFTKLGDGAESVAFGGEIVNQKQWTKHTVTRMGSGRFATRGYKKACYTSNIQIANDAYEWVEPNLIQRVTREECYTLVAGPLLTEMGSHIYFGGPGQSSQCQ